MKTKSAEMSLVGLHLIQPKLLGYFRFDFGKDDEDTDNCTLRCSLPTAGTCSRKILALGSCAIFGGQMESLPRRGKRYY